MANDKHMESDGEPGRERNGARRRNVGLVGAVVGAFLASLCCLGPLVLLALGLGGAWVGNLTALVVGLVAVPWMISPSGKAGRLEARILADEEQK